MRGVITLNIQLTRLRFLGEKQGYCTNEVEGECCSSKIVGAGVVYRKLKSVH